MPTVDPARLAAALERLGLTELQAQNAGINLHPEFAPAEVRGLLDGSEALDKAPVVEDPVHVDLDAELAGIDSGEPEDEDEAEEGGEPKESDDGDDGDDEGEDEPSESDESEGVEVENPADGVNIDDFEGIAKDLTNEQLIAARDTDSRKGVQVIASTVLEERMAAAEAAGD